MKVLNLQCSLQHQFEGWFASENDFLDQCQRGLLLCPVCADASINKLPSAPRLNLSKDQRAPLPAQVAPAQAVLEPSQSADWLAAVRHILASTDDVGSRFTEEARKMHYGETEPRAIRGQASRTETIALLDEGIAVLPLLLPESLKNTLQ